jgi:DNA-binding MarR family transcriptional regulator
MVSPILLNLSGMTRSRPPDTVPQALGYLRVALEDSYARASRELGLTPPQAELLCAALQPSAVGRLAQALRCDRTNVTHLVDRAVERGWVERRVDASDRRSSVVALTRVGERLANRFVATLEGQLTPLLQGWSDRRRREGTAILREIAEELDRVAIASAPPTD